MIKYICYETEQIFTKEEWESCYNDSSEIDKLEYPEFSVWWHDMMHSKVLEKVDVVMDFDLKGEKIRVFKENENDYSIWYPDSDYSLCGSLEDVKQDFLEHTGETLRI